MIFSNFERVVYVGVIVFIAALVVGKFIVNEITQQIKHITFHLNNITHERFYGDPTTSLSYYVRR